MSRLLRIAVREYVSYVRTAGFWLSLCAMPILMAGLLSIPAAMDRSAPEPTLAIADFTGQGLGQALAQAVRQDSGPPMMIVAPPRAVSEARDADAADQALRRLMGRDESAGAYLDAAGVLRGAGQDVSLDLWSRNLADATLETRLRADLGQALRRRALVQAGVSPRLLDQASAVTPQITVYSPQAAGAGRVSLRDRLPTLAGFGMGFLLWSTVLTAAQILMSSVLEEKAGRILEVLLTSVSTVEIMGGKIAGAAAVTLSVLAIWTLLGATILQATYPGLGPMLVSVLLAKGLLVYFALYLVAGYLMYASVFVAIGAFCETPREAQTLLAPVMLMLSVPLVCMAQALRHPGAPVLTALSWIPPFTPFLMIARAAAGAPGWQTAGGLALMAVFAAAVTWISAKAFRLGALSAGRPDLKTLLRGWRS